MMDITVTKIFTFEYGHFLPEYEGKCGNLHGHSGVLEVEVSGSYEPAPYENMICDFSFLSKIVNNEVISKLDHTFINNLPKNSNDSLWELMRFHPTAERMLMWILSVLQPKFQNYLERIRLWETKNSYAEWRK